MRRDPERFAQRVGRDVFDAQPDADVFDAGREEELVAEEGLDDGWDAGVETCAGRPGTAVVDRRVDLLEEPVVGSRGDLEDCRW